jgi:NodT family efflux transporter outer membrane factor (OMF) lipoprotein
MNDRVLSHSFLRIPAMVAITIAASACTVGPEYHRPSEPMPAHWSEPGAREGSWVPVPAQWWSAFGDPELDALIKRALQANLGLQLADSRIREARALATASSAPLWPSVDARGSAQRGGQSKNAPGVSPFGQGGELGSGTGVENLFQAGFDASWELDLFGGTRRSIEAAKADAEGAAFDRDAVQLSLMAEVARTYMTLRDVQVQRALAQRGSDLQRDALTLVQARYAGGMATDEDVAQAEAQLRDADAGLPLRDAQAEQAIHQLAVLLGTSPGDLASELMQARAFGPMPVAPDADVPSDLLRRRPDIQHAERQVAAATARVGAATAELYPQFSLNASPGLASFTADNFFNRQSTLWSIGPAFSWPVFRHGQIKAMIHVRDEQAQQALIAYRLSILTAMQEVEDALAACREEHKRYGALAASHAAQLRALAHARALYQGGMADFRVVLDQQQRVLPSESAMEQSLTKQRTDLVELYKALGGGWNGESP